MKGARFVVLIVGLMFFANLAFAGPQIAVSDPGCTGTVLTSNTFNFTFDPSNPVLTFCNGTQDTWKSLNFNISFGSGTLDLAGIYCGGPDPGPHAAFDYCMVLDPSLPNQTNGQDPAFGQLITSYLVHEFVATFGDGPSNFYSNPSSCFFNCANSGGPPPADVKSSVELSFNLVPDSYDPKPGDKLGGGLAPGNQFTIDLGCNQTQKNCQNWSGSTSFYALAGTSQNTTQFPSLPVPEPASIALLAVGLPMLVRKLRKH